MEYDELGFSPHSNSRTPYQDAHSRSLLRYNSKLGSSGTSMRNASTGASRLYLTVSKFLLAFTYNTP